ncbi:beta-barrel assembly-enhancing protease [Abditibacteriota bacterium]|nr:beta-barrel assembly-enhancing protease [Abditibacteriota bacterium]
MNQSFIAPASVRPDAIARARRLRRGLLLSGATGMSLALGAAPLLAQSLTSQSAPASTPAMAAKAARAALNQAKIQEAAGSVGLAAVQYREALTQAPTDPSVARELARFYTRQNRTEEAATEWKRVLILKAQDAEATRELAHLARLTPTVATISGTGVADVAPLPPVLSPKTQTRALANRVARISLPPINKTKGRVLLAQVDNSAIGPLPDAPLPDAPLPLPATSSTAPVSAPVAMPVADSVPRATLAPLPPATKISPIPFSLPARRAVNASKKNKADAYPFVNSGAQLLNQNRPNRALLEYQRGADLDPSNPYALPGVATSQIILGHFAEAAATYRKFLAVAPAKSVDSALRGLADALTYGKKYREALGVNSFILSRNPRDFAAAYQNGQVYTFLRSYGGADAAFQRALSIKPDAADALTAWGESLSYRRDPRAATVLMRALQLQVGNPRATLALGNYYLYSGQFNLAVTRYQTVLHSQPNNVAVLISLGDSLAFSGHPNAAVAPYSKALSLQPGNTKAMLGKGRALVYSGQFSEGARYLNPIVAADRNNAEALEALAIAQAATKSPNAASSYSTLLTLQNEPSARARSLAALGDLRLEANDIPGAAQFYAQAVQLQPGSAKYNLVYAQILSYDKGGLHWKEAGDYAARSLAIEPNNPQAQAIQLRAALEIGDQDTATRLAGQIENLKPTSAGDSLALALALFSAGRATGSTPANPTLLTASRRLLLLAASQVDTPGIALRVADATRDAEDYPTAIALYQRLIQVEPNNVQAHLGLVKTLFYSNSLQDAQTQAASLLAIAPNDTDSQVLAAQIQMQVGTPESRDNAARIANAILARDPENSQARTLLGQALTSRARFAEAITQFQAAITKNPNNLEARLGLARNLNYARDIEGSIQQYRELIQVAPADSTPRLELAQILLDRSRYSEAEALYNEVLVLRRSASLLPSVRRAIASNSLRRLSPLARLNSPFMRSSALVVPRASKHRVVVNNPMAPRADKRRLFAQNPEMPSETLPTNPGTGVLPEASTTTPSVNTIPSTSLGGTGTGPEVAPPLQNGPTTTTPDTTTPETPPTTNETTPPVIGGAGAPSVDSPLRTASDEQGAALRGLGESRFRQNQFADAVNFFNQALGINPNDYEARVRLARTLRSQGQFNEALQQVQVVLDNDSNNLRAIVLQSQLLADTGQTAEANAKLDSLISLLANQPVDSPTLVESYTQVALGLNAGGNYTKSLDLLGRAITLFPTEPSLERLRAQTLSLAGQTDAALTAYDALIATDARDSDSLVGKARVLNYANRLAESETAYRQALQVQGDNPQTQSELADVLGRRGNITEAAALYQTALQASPNNVAIRVNLARLLRAANQPADAEAALNQALEVEPNNVDALVERGLVRGTSGNYASGIADLNRALTLLPSSESAQLGLAQVQSYAQQYTEAIASYQAFLANHPDNARARVELAQTLGYAGRSTEALTELDTVLGKTPDDGRALLARAEILASTNRPDEAIKIYNALLVTDPQNTRASLGLADALLYARRYNDAITAYDKILVSDPNNGGARIARARALSYAGRAREAVTALRAIVTADPTNVTARLALAEAGANSGNATLQRDAIGEYRAVLKDNPDNLTAQLGLARVLSYRGNYAEAQTLLNAVLKATPENADARLALADTLRFAGKPFDAKRNYQLVTGTPGTSASILSSARTGISSLRRATSPSIGVSGSYYDDTNGIRLRSVGESAILRTRALTIGVLADQGRFHQNNLAERNRRNIGILLARQFGPFAAQLIVSRLKYSGAPEKTLYNLSFNREFNPRKRFNLSFSRRDIFESDLAVGSGITANIINLNGTIPLGKRLDFDGQATYYRYSDSNSRITLSPSLMFRFSPTNPSLRVGVGYIYDNTDQPRNAPFVYYTPQDFNAAAILADYIVTTGKTRYGISGAVPLTGSTGTNGINRPADTLFGFFERDLGSNLDFNIRGGIVRVPDSDFRSNQISGGLNLYF